MPCSYSIPAYRSSVFSRTTIRLTLPNRVRTPSYVLHGRTCAYRSRAFRRPTLTERKPPPTGVVIGPLSATPVRRIESSVWSGKGFPPNWSITSAPACCTSQSNSTPVASRTRRVASVSSGPVPSPGVNVASCAPVREPIQATKSPFHNEALSRRGALVGPWRRPRSCPYLLIRALPASLPGTDHRTPATRPHHVRDSRPPVPVGFRAMADDFKPGLEGVVAVETEIAEPDREGGSLRYRGIDIEELVGRYPYENVWGLLVDDDLDSKMPDPEPYEPAALTGNAPSDLQAETARLSGVWGLGKLNEISDEQARVDLGRLSAQMMSIVARSARVADGKTDVVPDDVVAQGQTAAEKFLLRWRGEADTRHAKAIDTYWLCTAEHGLNGSTFTATIVSSTGADCGASLSGAVGALSGPLHGGAPAYVKPMLEEVAQTGDAERWVRDTLAAGKRIMGFGHRLYRAGDPRSGLLKRPPKELGPTPVQLPEEREPG